MFGGDFIVPIWGPNFLTYVKSRVVKQPSWEGSLLSQQVYWLQNPPSLQKVNVVQLLSARCSIPHCSYVCIHTVVKTAVLFLLLALLITNYQKWSSRVIAWETTDGKTSWKRNTFSLKCVRTAAPPKRKIKNTDFVDTMTPKVNLNHSRKSVYD